VAQISNFMCCNDLHFLLFTGRMRGIAQIVCVDFYEASVKVAFVDGRKGQRNKICRPEVDWVISLMR